MGRASAINSRVTAPLRRQRREVIDDDYKPSSIPPDFFLLRPAAQVRIERCSDVGIDTVRLRVPLPPGAVRSDHLLRSTSRKNQSEDDRRYGFLFVDDQGEEVWGCTLSYSDTLLYVSIRPDQSFIPGESLHGGCLVTFSVSKLCGQGDNTSPARREELRGAFLAVEQRLWQIGLCVSLQQAKLSRLDLFRNIEADPELISYLVGMFSRIHLTRKTSKDYSHGVQRRNKSETLSVYDKGVEVSCRLGMEGSPLRGPLRIEWQMKTGAKIRRATPFSTVNDLLDGADLLPNLYCRYISEKVLPWDANAMRGEGGEHPRAVNTRLALLWKLLKRRSISHGWSRRRLEHDLWSGGWSNFWEAMKHAARDKDDWASLRRQLGDLKEALVADAMLDPDFASRYTELKQFLTTPAEAPDQCLNEAV